MIVDACLFAGEAEMLDLRFQALALIVDHFVVVACTRTHQGEPADVEQITAAYRTAHRNLTERHLRPSTLVWHEPSRLLQRENHLTVERPEGERGPALTPWFQHIEKQHRNAVPGAVRDAVTDDPACTVAVSDVDEIPTIEALAIAAVGYNTARTDRFVCAQRFHSGALDLLHPVQPWWGTCIGLLGGMNAQQHRNDRTTIGTAEQNVTVIPRAGWHLSWFGTDTERRRKLDTFSHAELRDADPAEWRRLGIHSNGEQLRKLTLAELGTFDWPAPLRSGSFQPPDSWWS